MGSYLSLSVKGRGWGGGERLFEAGRLLTFSAFRMGAYLRWAIIQGWVLIRINTINYHLHHFHHLHCQLPLPSLLSLCFSSSFLSSSSSSSSSLFIMTTFLSSPLSLMTCCCCFSLDALDPDAYEAFQASNNLSDVVQRCLQKKHIKAGVLPGMSKKLSIRASLMTPVKPMLVCINGVEQDLLWRSEKNL